MNKVLCTLFWQIVQGSLLLGSRLVGLPPNVSPLGTVGFTQKNPIPFIAAIVLFDVLFGGFYAGFMWTYLGFAGYYLIGAVARRFNIKHIALLPLASTWFFAVSNIGSWLQWYEPTFIGLISCYAVALPFYAYTLIGDCGFGFLYATCKNFKRIKYVQTEKLTLLAS